MSTVIKFCSRAHVLPLSATTEIPLNESCDKRAPSQRTSPAIAFESALGENKSINSTRSSSSDAELLALRPTVSGAMLGPVAPRLQTPSHPEANPAAVRKPGFEHAVLPHLDAAHNLARWLMHDPVDAEDIVQDACVRALQYYPSFGGGNGKAWLLQIVRNIAYTKLKAGKMGSEISLDNAGIGNGEGVGAMEIPDPAAGPEVALAAEQDLGQLRAAVAALPANLRECLILREMEEFSYKEIARITETSIGTVMSRLYRARCRLLSWTANTLGLPSTRV